MKGRHYHLIGVAGIGMCGVARLLLQKGAIVSGSDCGDVDHLRPLEDMGLQLYRDHQANHVGPEVEKVVYSVAVANENPELVEARQRQLPCLKYAQMVGRLMEAKRGICVAGTHGKTTTSSMIAWILRQAERDPSFIIGAEVPQLGGSSYGGGDDFVLESCEYDRSFHNYFPEIAVVTNVDLDHLDYYQDLEEIQQSFVEFAQQVKGTLFVNGDDLNSQPLMTSKATTFGWDPKSDVQVIYQGTGRAQLKSSNYPPFSFELSVPGKHNLLNAAAAALVALELGCSEMVIQKALKSFLGATRRFQILYEDPDYVVVDDYAHHPVEIQAVLEAAREKWPDHRQVVIFQPHQHSRTRFLMSFFASALSQAEYCLLPDIYFVRDSQNSPHEVSSQDLVRDILKLGSWARHTPEVSQMVSEVKNLREGPLVVLLLGAGDIWKWGKHLCP